jgi:hypothetical protein
MQFGKILQIADIGQEDVEERMMPMIHQNLPALVKEVPRQLSLSQ